ncbi:MAG: iron ABC transporter permease [Planctomycetaceae bacterium]|nr:iron ABC transporter permease [Planctomycetaceae bacterium]
MRRYRIRDGLGCTFFNAVIVTSLLLPLGDVLLNVFRDSEGVWEHLAETVLFRYISNTAILALGVVSLTVLIGVTSAWIVTNYEFPGRSIVQWALILPLAIPSYLLAYAVTDFFKYSGPVQTMLRKTFQLERGEYWFPAVRSLPGAVCILSAGLYPYVYLACRTALFRLDRNMIESSRTLGAGMVKTFFKVVFPLVSPAVFAAAMLVLMETLAEFGAVDYCAVDTFATGVYRTWLSHGSLVGAGQLSACLILVVVSVLLVKRLTIGNRRVSTNNGASVEVMRRRLGMIGKFLVSLIVWFPVVMGFIMPVCIFVDMTWKNGDQRAIELLGELGLNSIQVSIVVATVCTTLSFLLFSSLRRFPETFNRIIVGGSGLGYAIPGTVIAIGCLSPFFFLEETIGIWFLKLNGQDIGVWLTGSIAGLVFGCVCRFAAVSNGMVRSGYDRIPLALDDASLALGRGPVKTLYGVHLPLLSSSILIALLMVFVDSMKELPITLVLRPFNFDTLAVRVYHLASDERLDEAAASALAIIVVGLLPVIVLSKHVFSNAKISSPGSLK